MALLRHCLFTPRWSPALPRRRIRHWTQAQIRDSIPSLIARLGVGWGPRAGPARLEASMGKGLVPLWTLFLSPSPSQPLGPSCPGTGGGDRAAPPRLVALLSLDDPAGGFRAPPQWTRRGCVLGTLRPSLSWRPLAGALASLIRIVAPLSGPPRGPPRRPSAPPRGPPHRPRMSRPLAPPSEPSASRSGFPGGQITAPSAHLSFLKAESARVLGILPWGHFSKVVKSPPSLGCGPTRVPRRWMGTCR